MNVNRLVTRRTALAGTVGAALAATAISPRLFAQESNPTPAPGERGDSDNRERLLSGATERASLALDIVQTDLAAVAGQIDATLIEDLIGRANACLDLASSDTTDGARIQYAIVSLMTTGAASTLIASGINTTPLPSQAGMSSHLLTHVYGEVDRIDGELATETDSEVALLLGTSRDLYAVAYQQYGEGSFGQALGTGEASATLAHAARLRSADPETRDSEGANDDESTWLGDAHPARRRDCARGRRRRELFTGPDGNIIDFREPTEVPEPDFQN